MKKILSILLSVCMLLSMCSIFVFLANAETTNAETTNEETTVTSSWDNGNILNVSNEFGGDKGGTNLDYYKDTDVFKYVYFYAGTHPSDTREATYYDMVKGAFWAGPEWYAAGTATDIDERKNTGHAAANVAPNFHYAPGVCFTAPLTGTVEFTYQYACLDNLNGANHSFVVVKGEVDFREAGNCIISKTSKKTVGGYAETKSYDEVTFRVEVEAGDRIYFMVNGLGSNQGMNSHWISSARYVVKSDAVLLGHGLATSDTLDLRFLVQISDPSNTPTATVTVKTPLGDRKQTVNGQIYTGAKKDGGSYTAEDHVYAFTVELSAKQMTDEVVIAVNDTSLTDTFTVESYCLGILELAKTDSSYTNAANTCAAMLLYGYMAQINFNYRTDKLPQVDKERLSALLGGVQ